MYLLRHFVFVAITLGRCALALRFRDCAAWLRHTLVWLGDSLSLTFSRSRMVECDCCGWRGNRFFLQTFISGTYIHRSREICPRCQSLSRQRQLVRHLRDRTELLSLNAPTILDIAPTKAVMDWFRKQGLTNITTVDLKPGVAAMRMDITRLGFKNDVFDFILCSHVLEHVPEDLVAMSEMLRVMKAGGLCVIQEPLETSMLETVEYDMPNPDEFDHVRASGSDFASRLKSVGFEITYAEDGMFEVTKPRPTAG